MLASTANDIKGYGWRKGQPRTERSANFQVLLEWNKGQVSSKAPAYFASKLGGGSLGFSQATLGIVAMLAQGPDLKRNL